MRRVVFCISLCALSFSATVSSAFSQPTSPDSIPRELAMALLGGRDSDLALGLAVGRAADGLPAEALLPGAVVLGSTRFSSPGAGTPAVGTSITVLRAALPLLATADSIRARLQAAGWRLPVREVQRAAGFLIAARAEPIPEPPPNQVCKGEEMVSFQPLPAGAQTVVTLLHRKQGGNSYPCASLSQRPSTFDAPVPVLAPPPGAQVNTGSSPYGITEFLIRATVTTTATVPDILRHYSAELGKSTWVASDSAITGAIAIRRFTYENATGAGSWSALFVASRSAVSGQIEVSMQARKQ